jgi:uncharacterized surface protein with fasciclin (FAS1) repeats
LIASLTAPASYSLLEVILRTHIAEGLFTTDDVRTSGKSIKSIEGFPLSFSSKGDSITINNGAKLVSASSTVVGNGALIKITSVLDDFVDMFGSDMSGNASTNVASEPGTPHSNSSDVSHISGTVASALSASPNLSTYTGLLKATCPEFFSLLDGFFANSKNISIFAPSNAVFEAMGGPASTLQPSNQPLSSYMLKYPFIDTTSAGQEMSVLGFPATVRRDSTGAITSANNAIVKREKICVRNVCVYTVDRWLDPVFGLF